MQTALAVALTDAKVVPALLLPRMVVEEQQAAVSKPEAMILVVDDSESLVPTAIAAAVKEVITESASETGSTDIVSPSGTAEPLPVGLVADGLRPAISELSTDGEIQKPVIGANVVQSRTRPKPKADGKPESGQQHKPRVRKELTTAYVFDAQRRDLQEDYLANIREGLIPEHNAECADISKEAEEIAKANAARAKTKKRARILRLVQKRWEIINGLSTKFRLELEEMVQEYKGIVSTVNVKEEKNGRPVEVSRQQIAFPDGSTSMMKTLYVPFDEFAKA